MPNQQPNPAWNQPPQYPQYAPPQGGQQPPNYQQETNYNGFNYVPNAEGTMPFRFDDKRILVGPTAIIGHDSEGNEVITPINANGQSGPNVSIKTTYNGCPPAQNTYEGYGQNYQNPPELGRQRLQQADAYPELEQGKTNPWMMGTISCALIAGLAAIGTVVPIVIYLIIKLIGG